MKVLFDGKHDYPDTNYYYYDWKDFEDDSKNLLYIYGIYGEKIPLEYKNKIYLNAEEPNGLYHSGKLLFERDLNGVIAPDVWTIIYQICPYSTDWMRDVHGDDRFKFLKHCPMCAKKYYPTLDAPKIYDFFYQGSLHGDEMTKSIDIIKNYKYVWTSLSDYPDSRKTHYKTPYLEKLKLLSQCKAAIVFNGLYENQPGAFLRNISRLPNWKLNEAFSHAHLGVMPQFKGKLLEHMLCKTLALVNRQPWDIMERFGFEEGEHFLYFDEVEDIPALYQECLSNWDYCERIINNAYNKVTTENSMEAIYNKYLKPYNE